MTERGRRDLHRSREDFVVGPSRMRWSGESLDFDLDERGAVLGEAVRGRVRVFPQALAASGFALDAAGRHRWQPVATRARIEVAMTSPALAWSGDSYIDSNFGTEPMEACFHEWQWSRAHVAEGARVFYEGTRRDGTGFALSLLFDSGGTAHLAERPAIAALPRAGWGMPRATRSDGPARLLATWENAPFYARSAIETTLDGQRVAGVHESLSLDRFVNPVVQWMLPFRMPRKA